MPGTVIPAGSMTRSRPAPDGLITLRISRPSFPWPPLDQLIDQAVDTILAVT